MSENTQTQAFHRVAKVPMRTRQYGNEQVPLPAYLLQGAGGLGFMMFIFWLAGFGS